METSVRNNYIDLLKAIGITLMVVGHSGCPLFLRNFIYMFHMPLFFFISGYLLNTKYSYKDFCKRKIKSLYIPYLKYTFLFVALNNIFFYFGIVTENSSSEWQHFWLYGLNDYMSIGVKTMLMMHFDNFLLGYWFLQSLLISTILVFFAIRKSFKLEFLFIILFFICIVEPMIYESLYGIGYIISKAFKASLFVLLGYFYKNSSIKLPQLHYFILSIIFFCGLYYVGGDMNSNHGINYILYSISALSAILLLFETTKMINTDVSPITCIGKHSFHILTFHLLSFKVVTFIILLFFGTLTKMYVFPTLNDKSWLFIPYSVFGVLIPILGCYIKKRIGVYFNSNS